MYLFFPSIWSEIIKFLLQPYSGNLIALAAVIISNMIAVAGVVIIFFYTYYTRKLLTEQQKQFAQHQVQITQQEQQFRQQEEQFRIAQRPWVAPGEVLFRFQPGDIRLLVELHNFAKLPADCSVGVSRIIVSNCEGGFLFDLPGISMSDVVVFPYSGASHGSMLFTLTEHWQDKIPPDGCQLTIPLYVQYRTFSHRLGGYPYSTYASVEVPKLVTNECRQATNIVHSQVK
jgi:hypothetical protein